MTTKSNPDDIYETLLLEYASGCLDEARALIVAAHVSLSPPARDRLSRLEAIGGSILSGLCTPVDMSADARAKVLRLLDSAGHRDEGMRKTQEDSVRPVCLQKYLAGRAFPPCRTQRGRALVRLRTSCRGPGPCIVRLGPGVHVRIAAELALVIEGSLHTDGTTLYPGDLIVTPGMSTRYESGLEGCMYVSIPGRPRWRVFLGQWFSGVRLG